MMSDAQWEALKPGDVVYAASDVQIGVAPCTRLWRKGEALTFVERTQRGTGAQVVKGDRRYFADREELTITPPTR